MIQFTRWFRTLRSFREGEFEYEESGKTENGFRIFTVYGREKQSGTRCKVCEFTCGLDEKMCQEKMKHALWKINHPEKKHRNFIDQFRDLRDVTPNN